MRKAKVGLSLLHLRVPVRLSASCGVFFSWAYITHPLYPSCDANMFGPQLTVFQISVHAANVKQVLRVYSIEVAAREKDDLKEDPIISRLRKVSGAFKTHLHTP